MRKSVLVTTIVTIWFLSGLNDLVYSQGTKNKINTTEKGFWLEMMQDPEVDFYELQEAFNHYWANRTDYKGNGYKVFRRWEYINETRVLPDGKLQPNGFVLNEYNRYMKEIDGSKSAGGNWSIVAPLSYPENNTVQPTGMGRINALAFHPTDENTIYIGSPSGGFWKTTNQGSSWTNLCSNLPTLGVSSILVHPTDPDIIFIGTGDRDSDDAPGLGVYKTIDGGATWNNISPFMGDVNVGAMIMHPSDPNTILAATYGGIYKTTDGGATWSLKISGDFRDIRFKPGDPSVIYATMFISPSEFYRSSNTGDSWTKITSGVPSSGIGKRMVIGVSPANANVVYLFQIKTDETFAGLLRSTDAGLNFSTQSTTPNIMDSGCDGSGTGSQAEYDLCIFVDYSDVDIVYVGGVNIWKSSDGGINWTIKAHWASTCGGYSVPVHADHHVFEKSPHYSDRVYSGHDGGVSFTADGGSSWTEITGPLPITQIYKIGQSATTSDLILYGQQDNGTAASVGSNLTTIRGGDGTECIVDYSNTNYCYDTYVMGDISRSTTGPTGSYFEVASTGTHGIGADESGAWVTPYFLHNANPSVMFAGYENVFRCDNIKASPSSSVTWTAISTGETNTCRVMEQSPANPDIIYVARSGSLKRTDNANTTPASVTWTDCPLPGGSRPTDVKAHPTDANIVYAVTGSNVFKSTNKGSSWTDISGNLPALAINCLVVDKNASEGIYIGNQTGVWYKDASMTNWALFSDGLPPVDIRELEIYYDAGTPSNNRIKAGTYGRGLWQSDLMQLNVIDPSDFTATAASSSQIDLAWTTNPSNNNVIVAVSTTGTFGVPSDGTAYSVGNTLPSGGGEIVYNGGLTSLNHTSLSSGTTYYYKIWSVNGSNQYSAGLSPVSETTDCASISTLPYSENFENPTCWRTKDNSGQGNWQFGNTSNVNYTPNLTAPYVYFKSEYGEVHDYSADLISPPFNLSDYPNVLLQFNHLFDRSSVYSSTGTVYYSTDNGATWVSLASYSSADSPNPEAVSLSVNGAAGQSQVKFKWNYTCSPTGAYMWCVDDVQISDNSNFWTGTTDTDWFKNTNWSTIAIPTSTTSVVIPSTAPNQPEINESGAVCLNLTIQTGASLTMNASTAYTLSVAGDWTNNGTFTSGIGTVEFVGTNSLQYIKGSSSTSFYILKVSTGSRSNILEDISQISTTSYLLLNSGTFKLNHSSSTVTIGTSSADRTIGSSKGLWVNAGTVSSTGTLYSWGGDIRVSGGLLNLSNTTISYANNGNIIIEGGELKVIRIEPYTTGSSAVKYSQSGGIVTVAIAASSSLEKAPFDLTSVSSFTMSDGSIIVQTSSSFTYDYYNLASTNSVSGGTIQVGNSSTASGKTIRINSTAPIYNLVVNATNSPTAQLVTNELTVMKDVTISGGTFNANDLNIAVGGNWTNNGAFTAGTGIVTLNGVSTQTIDGSSSTTFNNLTIDGTDVALGTTAIPMLTTVSNGLTINTSKKLTVPALQFMTVGGTITNNSGTSGLVIKSDASGTGSLIHSTADVDATFERYMNNADWANWQDGWHFLSTPVATQAISSAFTTDPASGYDFYGWYEPDNIWVNFKNTTESPTWIDVNGSNNFYVSRGYMAAYDEGGTKSFSGTLNVSDASVTGLEITGSKSSSWHLLGNPFSSALSWDAASAWSLTGIGGVAKIWNEANQSYTDLTSSPASEIPATNGFMVQVTTEPGSLVLPASKRVHSSQSFYKSTMSGLKLTAFSVEEGNAQECRIILNPSSTVAFDPMFDSEFLKGHAPEFYSISNDKRLSTNSLPEIADNSEIMLGFVKNSGNEFRIVAEDTETLQTKVYLHDLKTGVITLLNEHPEYSFTAFEGDNQVRFLLKFGEESAPEEDIQVYFSDNTLNLQNFQGEVLVEIFSLTGQKLLETSTTGNSIRFDLTTGIYLVRVKSETQVHNFKIFKD